MSPDMIILPGTKSTIFDLLWMRQNGLEASIQKAAARGTLIFGICGGYQMLGNTISDPNQVEAAGTTQVSGLGLLDLDTVFEGEKVQKQVSGCFGTVSGMLQELSSISYTGYEIHMGRSNFNDILQQKDNVYGSYLHGIFDADGIADVILQALCAQKGIAFDELNAYDAADYKEQQYDILADAVRSGLDMELVYKVLNREV